jgi:hypothetical protein
VSSISKYLHQRPMARTGPPGGDSQARASEAAVNSLTGGSRVHGGPPHRHTVEGDRRTTNFHSGAATRSTVDRTSPGRAIDNQGGNNGLDE